jgi:hypothetical protein
MTGQIHDKVNYAGVEYDLVSLHGTGLFEPPAYGMLPQMIHTACWRGYYCTYSLDQAQLFLTSLTIRTQDRHYPLIGGLAPTDDGYGTMRYSNLRLPLRFSGQLLLGADFVREKYVHMGFQSPEAYRKIVAVVFSEGKLVSAQERPADFTPSQPANPPARL